MHIVNESPENASPSQHERKCCAPTNSRLTLAIIFIAAGILLMLNRLDILSYEVFRMFFNWPMLLIAVGLYLVFVVRNRLNGSLLTLVGLMFFLPKVIDIPMDISNLLLPVGLIIAGLMFLINRKGNPKTSHSFDFQSSTSYNENVINHNHIMGGGKYLISSSQFSGGRIDAIMGGGTYDFMQAKLAPGINILDLSFVMGGVELIVPAHWNIKIEVESILGGFNESGFRATVTQNEADGILVLKGKAVLGGGEIKRR